MLQLSLNKQTERNGLEWARAMIIYKAQNIITGETYIGQTKKALCNRKRDHVYEAFKRGLGDKFHSALREFGLRNFEWSIVAEFKSYKKLTEAENEAIHFHDSIKHGYNTQIRHDASAAKRVNKSNYRNGFKSNLVRKP